MDEYWDASALWTALLWGIIVALALYIVFGNSVRRPSNTAVTDARLVVPFACKRTPLYVMV
jgi:hypothetical protein